MRTVQSTVELDYERHPMSLTQPSDAHLLVSGQPSAAQTLVQRGAFALAASAFVAVCAHIAVPVPFTPVPFTLQPFAVILVGMLLGPVDAFAALLAYLSEGAIGLPVFTPGGPGGALQLLGPSGGYLLAYPFAAACAGLLPVLTRSRRFGSYAAGGALAMLLIFAAGAGWLSHVLHLSMGAALKIGVLPFAASDAVKVCAAAGIVSAVRSQAARN